jgi:polysaccharide export outer membrane protein
VALPLVGNVHAAKRTIREFEGAVREKLSQGYLYDPRVSVQIANYRPFFILGEVSKPGSYPFVNGMNVLNAVALAGGYTYRADRNDIVIVHANDPSKKEAQVSEDSAVLPGDIIRVPERFF